MTCLATRKTMILAILIAGAQALSSRIALAEVSSISAEVKPLPLIVNVLPGSNAFAAEGEARVSDNLGVFFGMMHLQVKLDDDAIEKHQDEEGRDEPLARDVLADVVTTGARYYGNATGSSWYAGGGVGAGAGRAKWIYEDARVTDRAVFYQAGLQGGYLWQWDSGLLVRLGAGANWNSSGDRELTVDNESADKSANEKAKDEIEDKTKQDYAAVTPTIDLGLGYRF